MMRFQTAIASLLGTMLVVPVFLGQGQVATLQDALNGTKRALEVLKGVEQRLLAEPAAALGLVLSATELPVGEQVDRDRRLESLRNEVNLLQMELDAALSPVLGPDGSVQSALGGSVAPRAVGALPSAGITTGLDDSLRALLQEGPAVRSILRTSGADREAAPKAGQSPSQPVENGYSADPLRHGITCYRAGRYSEAIALLAPLDDGAALYWQARTLERLERLDEAVKTMERAIQKGGEGFEQRRAKTDLEFLLWKRDFVKNLPGAGATTSDSAQERPR